MLLGVVMPLYITSKTESMKEIIGKLSFITIKNLSVKDNVREWEDKPHQREIISKRHIPWKTVI